MFLVTIYLKDNIIDGSLGGPHTPHRLDLDKDVLWGLGRETMIPLLLQNGKGSIVCSIGARIIIKDIGLAIRWIFWFITINETVHLIFGLS
jgi:hypothetical protein